MMNIQRFQLCICLMLACCLSHARSFTIHIKDQSGMDSLADRLYKSLDSGDDEIIVNFSPGNYYYPDRLLLLDGLTFPQTQIRFIGNGATLTAQGEDYRDGDVLTHALEARTGAVTEKGDVLLWSRVFQSSAKIQVIDKENKKCSIRCKSLKKSQVADLSSCYILLTEWYLSKMFKVTEIEDGVISFIADEELDFLNADFSYARIHPRFKLLNTKDSPFYIQNGRARLEPNLDRVHICRAGRLLSAYGATFKSISFEGFRFLGNQDNVFALMDFTETQTEGISITHCEFCGIRSKLIQVAYTPSFTFTHNHIHDCYRSGVISLYSANTKVTDNVFENVGLAMSNDFCINCAGENYLISDNSISNFGYGGISIGLHFTKEKTCAVTGTVRNNELWYTPDYFSDFPAHTLMDSGAIYVTTQNDRTIIRDNYIHDYIGMRDNRGIFLDDGASHVIVINNTIERVPHGWSIDSRLVKEVETMPGSKVRQVNVGNLIHDNHVDGKIRFEKP